MKLKVLSISSNYVKVTVLMLGFMFLSLTLNAQTYHNSDISSNETWYAAGNPHILTATVTVLDGVTLTIEPDCTVKFDYGTQLIINGVLIANGSNDHRIYFDSIAPIPAQGDWRNIAFSGADPGCLLDYCEIENGGYQLGNIYVHNSGTNVTISNTSIRNSGTAGAYIYSNSTPNFINCTFYSNTTYGLNSATGYSDVILSNCSFESNGNYALNIYGNSVKNISGSLNLSGNGVNAILVNTDTNLETGTWANWGHDYVINGDQLVLDSETLTIEAGATLKFNGNYSFSVLGVLIADGDPANHITFTSNQATPTPGYWKYISFYYPDSPCVFDYCDVGYAGAVHSGSSRGNILMKGTGSYVNFSNCTISNGSTYGVKVRDGCNPAFTSSNIDDNGSYGVYCTHTSTDYTPYPTFSDCIIEDNGSYPLYLFADNADDISAPMTFSGNGADAIYLQYDDINTGTWTNFGIPYVIGGDIIVVDGETLTIEPGNTMKFASNYVFRVDGALIADGDPANHITFTSNQTVPAPGDWKCVIIYAPDASCVFDYCDVSFGGSQYGSSTFANITLYQTGSNLNLTNCTSENSLTNGIQIGDSCNPVLTSCTINNNGSYGVHCKHSGTTWTPYPSFSDCTFQDNSNYPLYLFADNAKDISSPMTFSGNSPEAIYLQTDDVNTGTWTNFGIPYAIGGDIIVADGETLTIEPGNTMKFANNYVFRVNGALIADGEPANHITFTSNQTVPAPGDWKCVIIYVPDAACIFDYCDVSFGGSQYGSSTFANIALHQTGSNLNLTNCTSENSLTNGILISDASPTITNCIVQNNYDNGIYLKGTAAPQFGTGLSEWNDIYGNASYEFYNNTTNDITAEYIYWGSVDYADINNEIYDQNDNGSLGLVDFTPWTNAAHDTEYPLVTPSAPQNVIITIISGNVNLEWDAVVGATSYKIYSFDDPYESYENWTFEAEVTVTNWSEVAADTKKFYYVTAVN